MKILFIGKVLCLRLLSKMETPVRIRSKSSYWVPAHISFVTFIFLGLTCEPEYFYLLNSR